MVWEFKPLTATINSHGYFFQFQLNRGDPDELIDTHCMSKSHQNAYIKKQIEEQEALKVLAEVKSLISNGLNCS